jgi:2',3'-cyclic-nucleotide 2'-phosphodiesterase (5'-nucleotidase family)
MRRFWFPSRYVALVLTLVLLLPLPALLGSAMVRAQDATPVTEGATSDPVLLFAAPGMQPDLVDQFAADGAMPTFAGMIEGGASGGLSAPFPATLGTTFPTLLTGTWPAEHGIIGDRFYRTGSPDFADWATWSAPDLNQADTLPLAAERAGKQVVAIGWPGLAAGDSAVSGPVVGDFVPFSQAGVVTNTEQPERAASAERLGVGYDAITFRTAEGWSNAPESFSPAQEGLFTIDSLDAALNPDRTYQLLVYDSTDDATENYDRLLVSTDKDAAARIAELDDGAWAAVSLELSGDRASEGAGFWVHAIDLSPDLGSFRLYYTPVGRVSASWTGCGERPECTVVGGFEESVNRHLGPAIAVDSAPLDAGLIDEETFTAQGITNVQQSSAALRYIVGDLGVKPDLLLLQTTFPYEATRLFHTFPDSAVAGGSATPVATENATGDRRAELLANLRGVYTTADELLATGADLLGPQANTIAVSSGGMIPSWQEVDAGQVLVDAGLAESAQPDNCVPGEVSAPPGTPDPEALPIGPAVKACWSGGTAHIYLNLDGREAAGSVAEDAYDATRDAIVAKFDALRDPQNPEATVVERVLLKEDLRDVGGSVALHPSRSGDVVVTLAPPYRFGVGIEGEAISPASALAVGGYLSPEAGDGLYLAAGPQFAPSDAIAVRAIDVAPTASFLLGSPGPYNASGAILFEALANGPNLRQATLLDISDFHGQLPPLTAVADSIDAEGAVSSSYEVGGVAVLGPWFDRYRAEANGDVILVTAGDAVGATPPISTAFGDVPTIEIMNALGFTADSLGNHNFDASAEYMFGTLAPLAEFPYLSANLVPARADVATPVSGEDPFAKSLLLESNDVSVGLVGFSNPDIPNLTRPGALGPYRVIDPVAPIDEEAARLRQEGAEVVIALGHMGATGGAITAPTGPVVDVAKQLTGVDVVVADHTDFQVSAVLPTGVLLVENRSKGVMFTRVRVVVDAASGELIYRTADHHRPWVIGVSPDPVIAERLDQLQEELAPTLGQVIGSATKVIPRSDSCGMETGRTCESLIGDVITDAMRVTYETDFAITNSGGIRADLTCPPEGGDFCPTGGEPNQITEGQVLTVLPFGNVAVTLEVTGAELKAMLEAGVVHMPEPSGAFPQVSGLCFTYDLAAEPGNRVTGAVRQAGDGTCSGEAIDLTDAATYTLTTNDFTASGGDGYPALISRASSRDVLATVVAAYVAAESPLDLPGEPLDPIIEGRITCEGDDCPVPAGDR